MTLSLRRQSAFTLRDVNDLLDGLRLRFPSLHIAHGVSMDREKGDLLKIISHFPGPSSPFGFAWFPTPDLLVRLDRDGECYRSEITGPWLQLQFGGFLTKWDFNYGQCSVIASDADWKDKEFRSFVRFTWKEIERRSTRSVILLDPFSGRPVSQAFTNPIFLARGVVEWLGQDPARRFRSMLRPGPRAYEEVGLPIPDDPIFAQLDGLPATPPPWRRFTPEEQKRIDAKCDMRDGNILVFGAAAKREALRIQFGYPED